MYVFVGVYLARVEKIHEGLRDDNDEQQHAHHQVRAPYPNAEEK
jgi:hypothetical protein